jgi:plastocyanin
MSRYSVNYLMIFMFISILICFYVTGCGGDGGATAVNTNLNPVSTPSPSDGTGSLEIFIDWPGLTGLESSELTAQIIPTGVTKVRVYVQTTNGFNIVPYVDIPMGTANSTVINNITAGQVMISFQALDGSDNILSHRVAYKTILANQIIATTAHLGVTISKAGKFFPVNLEVNPGDKIYWGNNSSITYTVKFTVNDSPVSITMPAMNLNNPPLSYALYTLPSDVSKGVINVELYNGNTLKGSGSITVISPPVINTITPSSGLPGATVTISGSNFDSSRGSNTVTFNGVAATSYSSWSDSEIVCEVPSGAGSGNVVVTVDGKNSNGVNFDLLSVIYTLLQTS